MESVRNFSVYPKNITVIIRFMYEYALLIIKRYLVFFFNDYYLFVETYEK